jgi:predicted RNA-binding protein YlxR (DUF448 family)
MSAAAALRKKSRGKTQGKISGKISGSARGAAGSLRRCLASGTSGPKEGMLRFVVAPPREILFDPAGRLEGRGFWLRASRDVIETARAKNLFAKAARGAVGVPDDLSERVERALVSRCLGLLGLARRSGGAVAGLDNVRRWRESGRAAVLLTAREAKASKLSRGSDAQDAGPRELRLFDGAELGAVFGRPFVARVAVAPGRLAGRLRAEASRLEGLRPPSENMAGGEEGRAAKRNVN